MNMSQQRFFLLLHKLEGIETALADTKKEISEMAECVRHINEFTQVLNYRLLFAGQALLGKSFPGFNEMGQEAYNKGLDAPAIDSQEPVDTAVSRGPKDAEEKSRPRQTRRDDRG